MRNSPNHPVSPWRRELRLMLDTAGAARAPVLRRSRLPEFLYATDLPACASAGACAAFLLAAAEAGWESTSVGGWICLRKAGCLFPEPWPFFLPGDGEGACLRELSRRHPGLLPSRAQAIALLKAMEEGPAELEKACRSIHEDFARRLREKE